MSQLIAILYRSETLTAAKSDADAQIVSAAQARNTLLDVTGPIHTKSEDRCGTHFLVAELLAGSFQSS